MGHGNASYLPAVLELLPARPAAGRQALAFLREDSPMHGEGLTALRRYSSSAFAGQEDGKALNAALAARSPDHDDWARDMDDAFVWSFSRDVLLWRGYSVPLPLGEPSSCFVSTTVVERQARRFRSRGGAGLLAILLSAGSPVAVPSLAWKQEDDPRTLGVVFRESEIILPRGTVLDHAAWATPAGGKGDGRAPRVHVTRAIAPERHAAMRLG